jgi:hypothetical protein
MSNEKFDGSLEARWVLEEKEKYLEEFKAAQRDDPTGILCSFKLVHIFFTLPVHHSRSR